MSTASSASYSPSGGPSFDAPDRSHEERSANGPDSPDSPDMQDVKARVGGLLDDAKEGAQARLNEGKDAAADRLHHVADSLRGARDGRSGDDLLLGLTGAAADGLDHLSGALRDKDVSVVMRDMESFARAQPVAFFGLALATGFLAVRFLKASRS
jgi:hypothetical protein